MPIKRIVWGSAAEERKGVSSVEKVRHSLEQRLESSTSPGSRHQHDCYEHAREQSSAHVFCAAWQRL
jgi:hypothetical protein